MSSQMSAGSVVREGHCMHSSIAAVWFYWCNAEAHSIPIPIEESWLLHDGEFCKDTAKEYTQIGREGYQLLTKIAVLWRNCWGLIERCGHARFKYRINLTPSLDMIHNSRTSLKIELTLFSHKQKKLCFCIWLMALQSFRSIRFPLQ